MAHLGKILQSTNHEYGSAKIASELGEGAFSTPIGSDGQYDSKLAYRLEQMPPKAYEAASKAADYVAKVIDNGRNKKGVSGKVLNACGEGLEFGLFIPCMFGSTIGGVLTTGAAYIAPGAGAAYLTYALTGNSYAAAVAGGLTSLSLIIPAHKHMLLPMMGGGDKLSKGLGKIPKATQKKLENLSSRLSEKAKLLEEQYSSMQTEIS